MKNLITISSIVFMISSAQGSQCFVVNSCLKSVSSCENLGKVPSYYSFSGSVARDSFFRYEWKEDIECIHHNGRKNVITKNNIEKSYSKAVVKVDELRIPATLDEVDQSYISKVDELALEKCEENKKDLITDYNFCQ